MNELKRITQNLSGKLEQSIKDIAILKEKIIFLEKKVLGLEAEQGLVNTIPESRIINELLGRQYRAKNIILFNVTKNSNQNNLNDFDSVKNILSEMGLNLIPTKVLRITHGCTPSNHLRPIKIVLPNANDVYRVLKYKKNLQLYASLNIIRVSSDRI